MNSISEVESNLKVLHLISSRGFYGAERVIVNLTSAIDRYGFTSHIALLCVGKYPNREFIDTSIGKQIDVHVIQCKKWIDIGALFQIINLINKERFDIVHCHEMKGRLYGLISTIRTKAKLITTNHNWIRSSFLVTFFEILDAFYIRFFPIIIAVSPEVRELMRRYLVPDSRIRVIVNGVDMNEFKRNHAARDRIRKKLGITQDVKLIGTVGRLSPEKGQKYFIDAAVSVLKVFPETMFILVGDGTQRKELEDHVNHLGLSGKIIFFGFQKNIFDFYSSFDMFILPSLSEGTPMALLEAMSAELPVIATNVGNVSRIVENEKTGVLIPPANSKDMTLAIIKLLNNASEAERMSKKSLDVISKEYSLENMVCEYMQLYKEII